jgi:hypothetical protein
MVLHEFDKKIKGEPDEEKKLFFEGAKDLQLR